MLSPMARGNPSSQSSLDDEVARLLKLGVWKEEKDKKTGKTYYYNPKTKAVTWDLKKDLKKKKESSEKKTETAIKKIEQEQKKPLKPLPKLNKEVSSPREVEKTESNVTSPTITTSAQSPVPVVSASSPKTTDGSISGSSSLSPVPAVKGGDQATSSVSAISENTDLPTKTTIDTPASFSGYADPTDKLMKENEMLRQMVASGSKGQVALDFQAGYDALHRTNNALTVQMERMKKEYDAMAAALTDANKTIHEQRHQLSQRSSISELTKDEELKMTISHLREQNRSLVSQISELTVVLARGLSDQAFRIAELSGKGSVFTASQDHSGPSVLTNFLDSHARQALCPACLLGVTRMRDKMLETSQTNVGASRPVIRDSVGPDGGIPAHAAYQEVANITTPPTTYHYSEHSTTVPTQPTASGYGLQPSGAQRSQLHRDPQEPPAVMYGGFVVRHKT